uniref:CHK kinase-like domain-containing protein n=1 Tax=Panagrolaimus davidi TaxID=227884 RepID=A0A914R006_9BILA
MKNNEYGDIVNLEESISGHSFTIGWLLDSLRKNDKIYQSLHGKRPVKTVSAKDVSSGKGFFSAIHRCIITFIDSVDDSDNYSTIPKIPGFTSFQEAQSQSDIPKELLDKSIKEKCENMHKFECCFYNEISEILDAPVPKVYKTVEWILEAKQEGCIHMEDLTLRGKSISFFDNINLSQIKYFIQILARMHKNILSADPKSWKGKFINGQNCYIDFFEMYESGYDTFLKKNKNYGRFFLKILILCLLK